MEPCCIASQCFEKARRVLWCFEEFLDALDAPWGQAIELELEKTNPEAPIPVCPIQQGASRPCEASIICSNEPERALLLERYHVPPLWLVLCVYAASLSWAGVGCLRAGHIKR